MPPTKKTTTRKTAAAKPAPEASQPVEEKYAPTTWGSGPAINEPTDLKVPSGQKCLVQNPGVEGLMKAGVINDIDSLTALVDQKHIKPNDRKAKKGSKAAAKQDAAIDREAMKKLLSDPEKMANMLHVVDRVVCHVVIKPEVRMTPNDPTSRKKGVIYADMIDLTDKMFIFQFVVGGTSNLEQFRGQLGAAVGSVESVEDVEGSSE